MDIYILSWMFCIISNGSVVNEGFVFHFCLGGQDSCSAGLKLQVCLLFMLFITIMVLFCACIFSTTWFLSWSFMKWCLLSSCRFLMGFWTKLIKWKISTHHLIFLLLLTVSVQVNLSHPIILVHLSNICYCNPFDNLLAETGVKKKVSELDGDPCGSLNFSSKSYFPGISGSNWLSEWSKDIVPHAESHNVSSGKVKDGLDSTSNGMHGLYESDDDNKPLSTFIGSWVGQGKNRKKNLVNTSRTR